MFKPELKICACNNLYYNLRLKELCVEVVYKNVSCRCNAIRTGLNSASAITVSLYSHRNKDTDV
jgi:hypothetical protein